MRIWRLGTRWSYGGDLPEESEVNRAPKPPTKSTRMCSRQATAEECLATGVEGGRLSIHRGCWSVSKTVLIPVLEGFLFGCFLVGICLFLQEGVSCSLCSLFS